MKEIIAKALTFRSKFGMIMVHHVPVTVEDKTISSATFNEKKNDFRLNGEVIKTMTLIAALKFFIETAPKHKNLTKDEAAGIMFIMGLNQSEFAKMLGLTKGTVSRILSGKLRMKKPESMLALIQLGLFIGRHLKTKKKIEIENIKIPALSSDFRDLAA